MIGQRTARQLLAGQGANFSLSAAAAICSAVTSFAQPSRHSTFGSSGRAREIARGSFPPLA